MFEKLGPDIAPIFSVAKTAFFSFLKKISFRKVPALNIFSYASNTQRGFDLPLYKLINLVTVTSRNTSENIIIDSKINN